MQDFLRNHSGVYKILALQSESLDLHFTVFSKTKNDGNVRIMRIIHIGLFSSIKRQIFNCFNYTN